MAKSKARAAKVGRSARTEAAPGGSDNAKPSRSVATESSGKPRAAGNKNGRAAAPAKGCTARTVAGGGRARRAAAPGQQESELDPKLVNPPAETTAERARKISTKDYLAALGKLQVELVKLQEWIRDQGLRVVIVFEGRDAAGKGGAIKTITQSLNPRFARVVALGTPTEREKTQWYFQRYVPHLPAAGEAVLFDRSWYNRAGVERVMGFCTDEEYAEFLRACPEYERMLVRSGIILIKYWFSVSDAEQERRFRGRIDDPTKRWKLSPMDLQSRARWVEYSKAKDEMFRHTDIKQAPWYVVNADNKKRARLNVVRHLLSLIPYQDLTPEPIVLPPREPDKGYVRPPMTDQTFVPEPY
jgi:polyphosphate kinase